ncbi:MAG: hypothetical protein ACHQF3_04210, partial [Alphaproteobacteria bacterium]
DMLFEAESAERAVPAVKRLLAIAQRPPLRLAALHGRLLAAAAARPARRALAAAGIAAGLASHPPQAAFAAARGEAAPRGDGYRPAYPAAGADGDEAPLARHVTSR